MSAMASQITSFTTVYSTVCSRRRSKQSSKLRVTGLCAENSPATGEFPAQRASDVENVSIWWRHHDVWILYFKLLGWITDWTLTPKYRQAGLVHYLYPVYPNTCLIGAITFLHIIGTNQHFPFIGSLENPSPTKSFSHYFIYLWEYTQN